MRNARARLLAIVGLVWLVGCASTPAVRLYQAGAASKAAAETTYQAIYHAYRAGRVSEADMAKARMAYDAWADIQTRYVQAAEQGLVTPALIAAVQGALQDLLNLALQYGL